MRILQSSCLLYTSERPGLRYLVFTNDKEAAKEALEGEHTERKMTYISELGAFSDIDEFFLDVYKRQALPWRGGRSSADGGSLRQVWKQRMGE